MEIVGTVTVAAKRQQLPSDATSDSNVHEDRMSLILRMNDTHSRLGPCQLNPQVQAAGKKESDTVRLIRCSIPNAIEPVPIMKYKCVPEFRPALLRTRSALQVRDAVAKVTIEVRFSNRKFFLGNETKKKNPPHMKCQSNQWLSNSCDWIELLDLCSWHPIPPVTCRCLRSPSEHRWRSWRRVFRLHPHRVGQKGGMTRTHTSLNGACG